MARVTLQGTTARTLRAVWLMMCAAAPGIGAQGLPTYAPINPMATSRSGVYFHPYREASPGRWTTAWSVDYASAIEYNRPEHADYVLDAELLRLELTLGRDVGSRGFVTAGLAARGAYAGFMDGVLDWYHGVLGVELPERNNRPRNEFLYRVSLAELSPFQRRSGTLFLDDLRLGVGWRLTDAVQSVVSVTLPTATGPQGYGRGAVSASILQSIRMPISRRFVYEGSVGLGYTPARGRLARFQRKGFVALSSGVRARLWGRQALYVNLFYHSPYYRETALPALDLYELSLDIGWLFRTCRGTEWRIGLTEDPKPSGPGIDAMLRVGVAFRTRTAPCAGAGTPSSPDPAD